MKQVLLVALLSCTAASATQIMFPSYVFGKAGDRVTVSVGISGVDAPSGLGGFHLNFHEISVVSLLPPDELVAAQRLDLALLELTFQLSLPEKCDSYPDLYPDRCDPNKDRYAFLRITGELTDGLGNPVDTTFVAPEPGTGVALALGAALLGLRRYRNSA